MALPAWRGMQSAGSARLLRTARLATEEELIKEAQRVAPRTDKPGRSRLFRMSRSVVPASFYSYAGATQLGSARSKYFQLSLRRLSDQIVQDINRGPSWLQGDYPAKLLHQRHEKRRLINITPVSVWRSGEESAEDDARWEMERKQLGRLKIPLLERGNPDIDLIPTVIICSKKKIGKLAVTRFAVARLIWRSFDAAVRRLQDSPEALPNDSTCAFVFVAHEGVIPLTHEVLTEEMVRVLKQLASKSHHGGKGVQKQTFKRKRFHGNDHHRRREPPSSTHVSQARAPRQ